MGPRSPFAFSMTGSQPAPDVLLGGSSCFRTRRHANGGPCSRQLSGGAPGTDREPRGRPPAERESPSPAQSGPTGSGPRLPHRRRPGTGARSRAFPRGCAHGDAAGAVPRRRPGVPSALGVADGTSVGGAGFQGARHSGGGVADPPGRPCQSSGDVVPAPGRRTGRTAGAGGHVPEHGSSRVAGAPPAGAADRASGAVERPVEYLVHCGPYAGSSTSPYGCLRISAASSWGAPHRCPHNDVWHSPEGAPA